VQRARSLTALLSLSVLLGALVLDRVPSRLLLVASAIPIAILLNGIRVFLTGFLVYFVDPKLGEGFMHLTEGWLIFMVAFVLLGGVAWVFGRVERRVVAGRQGGNDDGDGSAPFFTDAPEVAHG
jgi:exosortase/archaeosortase family protein